MRYLIYFILTFFLSGCLYQNMQEETAEEKDTTSILLNTPKGFDFSTHRTINITILDTEEGTKYDVYSFVKNVQNIDQAEEEKAYDEVVSDAKLYKYIYSGISNGGHLNQTINLPKFSKDICIRRKGASGYTYAVVGIIDNRVIYDYKNNTHMKSTPTRMMKGAATTVLPARLNNDLFITGNAVRSGNLNTRGFDLEVTGKLTVSGQLTLNSNTTVTANEVAVSGNLILNNATIYSQKIVVSGWLNGSGNVYYCTQQTITGRLNTGGQLIQKQCGVDSDGDGVNDPDDAYPDDSTKAFQIFSPSESGRSTMAFEDLWPSDGDYDFNDLALSYRSLVVTNAQNEAVQIDFTCRAKSNFAGFTNAFGIEFEGITTAAVQSVTGTNYTEDYINLNTNGTEAGQVNAVVIFTDNSDNFLEETTISVAFTNPVITAALGASPFNPFIIANKEREKEIHLPYGEPTTLGSNTIDGVFKDSNGDYISTTGFPWGISIINDFKVPKEGVSIRNAYNHFNTWATSGGNDFENWYSDTAGYRNIEKLEN